MEQYPISNNGHIYHFDTGPFNWYVIEQSGRLTVVDAGFPGHYAILVNGLAHIGFALKDVSAILLTHAHADHMGFAERLRKVTGAPVYIHQKDRVAAGRSLQLPWFGLLSNAWRPYVSGMLGHAALNGVFTQSLITKLETIHDGQILDVPGKPHVFHMPGHTPGEVAFYLPESKIVLSGDTLITRHLLRGDHGAPQIAPDVLTDEVDAAIRSLDRYSDLGEVVLLPGHGKAWRGHIAEAVRQVQEKKKS